MAVRVARISCAMGPCMSIIYFPNERAITPNGQNEWNVEWQRIAHPKQSNPLIEEWFSCFVLLWRRTESKEHPMTWLSKQLELTLAFAVFILALSFDRPNDRMDFAWSERLISKYCVQWRQHKDVNHKVAEREPYTPFGSLLNWPAGKISGRHLCIHFYFYLLLRARLLSLFCEMLKRAI